MTDILDAEARISQLEAEVVRLQTEVALSNARANSFRDLLNAAGDKIAELFGHRPAHLGDGITYLSDGIGAWHKSVDFMTDARFMSAYNRGMNSGHQIGRRPGSTANIGVEWRVAICCWAAMHARRLPGDFVECGTNTGILSLAVCEYVDFNSTDKAFWLFDTFEGIPTEQLNPDERTMWQALEARGMEMNQTMYPECYVLATRNFAPFPKAHLIRGKVPDTLGSVPIDRVAYLSIDLNIEYPEREALAFFWPKLVSGGIVVFDDYGSVHHRPQKASHDAFARSQGVEIFALPTGQGLLLKS